MAAISVPTVARVGQQVPVTGSGWSTNPVTISLYTPNGAIEVEADFTPATGNISGFRFKPTEAGKFSMTATDGASTVAADIQVST